MELQLGLALPTPIKMFDRDINSSSSSSSSSGSCGGRKKRGFDQVLLFEEDRIVPKTLSLFLWTNQPNDEDDPNKDLHHNSSSAILKYLSLFLFVFFLYVCVGNLSFMGFN